MIRDGAVALQRPAIPLNVLLDYGLITMLPDNVPSPASDYVRNSVVQTDEEPMQFVVTGDMSGPAHVEVVLELSSPTVAAAIAPGAHAVVYRRGASLQVCLNAPPGPGPRALQVNLTTSSPALLLAMTAASGRCLPSADAPGD